MLLIYTPRITSRLNYIFDFFFNELFGIEYELTQDKGRFWASNEPKLNYSEEQISKLKGAGAFSIPPKKAA